METITLLLFCAVLTLCVFLDISIVYALLVGLVIFLTYGKLKRHSWKDLTQMVWSGIKTARNILITFMLIGMLTALWRSGGVIPTIICYASSLIHPSIFVLLTFLLNCAISVLMGTSFGTAATMGVICMTMANTMGINPAYVGGAVLAGAFFGDRCSPVSTSALLVSELTGTDLFVNIKKMIGTALPAFLLSCGLYFALGLSSHSAGEVMDVTTLFSQHFNLHWFTVVPAIAILVLAALRFKVKKIMIISILLAIVCYLFFQGGDAADLPRLLVFGYQSSDPQLASMMNGGGITSMLRSAAIVCIASSYSGIFKGTGLLDGIQGLITALCRRFHVFFGIVCTSIVSSMIACNQTLGIMLTHQLCGKVEPDNQKLAIDLEDSVVVIAPLIPWSIAAATPLSSIGAPTSSIPFAFFLYLLPLTQLVFHLIKKPTSK